MKFNYRKKRNFQRVLTLWSLIHSTRGEPLGIPCSLGQLCESALIDRGPTMHFKLLFLFLSLSFPVLVISASFQRFPTACALEFEKEHRRRRSRDLIKTTLTISRSLVNSRFRDRLLWSTWFSFSFDLFNGDCFNSEWRNGWRWNQRLGTCKVYWASNLNYLKKKKRWELDFNLLLDLKCILERKEMNNFFCIFLWNVYIISLGLEDRTFSKSNLIIII